MPRGRTRIGAGRPKGRSNKRPKGSVRLAVMTEPHSAEAVDVLVNIMRNGKSEAARIAASCAILDRCYGRPPAQVDVNRRSEVEVTVRSIAELRAAALADGIPLDLLPSFMREDTASETIKAIDHEPSEPKDDSGHGTAH
jgi:hypothetical protein